MRSQAHRIEERVRLDLAQAVDATGFDTGSAGEDLFEGDRLRNRRRTKWIGCSRNS